MQERCIWKLGDVRHERAAICALRQINQRWRRSGVGVCGLLVEAITYEILPLGASRGAQRTGQPTTSCMSGREQANLGRSDAACVGKSVARHAVWLPAIFTRSRKQVRSTCRIEILRYTSVAIHILEARTITCECRDV